MGSLFKSPAQTASQVAAAEVPVLQGEIGTGPTTTTGAPQTTGAAGAAGLPVTSSSGGSGEEGYVGTTQQQLRNAISNLGDNPYYAAAASMSPTPLNPSDVATFSAPPPPGSIVAQAPPPGAPSSNASTRYIQPSSRSSAAS